MEMSLDAKALNGLPYSRSSLGVSWLEWARIQACPQRRRMQVHEQLFLNPFHKWARYRRFPTTFVIHVLLVLLVSCQVLFYLGKDINHAHCSSQHFSRLFLGTPKGSLVLYEPQELQEAVRKAVKGIFEINDNTFNDVKLVVNGVIFPDTLPLKLRYRNQSTEVVELSGAKMKDELNSKEYLVQALPVLYNNDIRFLEDISIQFGLVEVVHQPIKKTPFMLFIAPLVRTRSEESHFAWNLTTTFDGTAVGRYVGSLGYSLRVSQNDNASFSHSGLHVCVICLAGLSIVLILRKVWRSIVILHRMHGASKRIQDELSPSEQLAVFNLWWGVSLLSHFFQLWATINAMEKAPDVSTRVARVGHLQSNCSQSV